MVGTEPGTWRELPYTAEKLLTEHVRSCDVMGDHVMSCDVMVDHVMSCDVMGDHVMS